MVVAGISEIAVHNFQNLADLELRLGTMTSSDLLRARCPMLIASYIERISGAA